MRRGCRVDDNQAEIVRVLRDMGAKVEDCSRMGSGYPDLNVIYRSRIVFAEVKDGRKPPSRRELTPDQVKFHEACAMHDVKVHIITCVDDAVDLIREMRK